MNRSQRRATVIRSIAAGLLCAGFGLGVVAPAFADNPGDDGPADAGNPVRGSAAGSAGAGDSPASTRRGMRPVAVTDKPEWRQDAGWAPDWNWPCHINWPTWPNWPDMLAPLVYRVRTGIILFPHAVVTAPPSQPVAVVGPHASVALGVATAEAPESVPPDVEAAGPAAQLAVAAPLAPPPPAPVTPQPPVPETVAPKPNSTPNPFHASVPSVNLHEVAAAALPGLAGIAALTALGGLLGYRQAKAGYVLRAAGTARFLQ